MKTFRKRTGKKKDKLRGQDEFLSLSQRALRYAQGHTRQVYAGFGVLAVAVILTTLVAMIHSASRKKVMALEGEALRYYDMNSPAPGAGTMSPSERLKKADSLFNEIVESHGGSPAWAVALYYKANSDMELGDMDAAIAGYNRLVDNVAGDPLMTSLALKRLAEAYQAKGDRQGAVSAYMRIIKIKGGYLKDETYLRLADTYAAMGRKDEAVMGLRAMVKDFPGSPFAGDARKDIALLTGVPETAVPPGPAVPAAPAPAGKGPAAPIYPPAAGK